MVRIHLIYPTRRVEAGKTLESRTDKNQNGESTSHSNQFPVYVIEFKAGRRDFFYLEDASHPIKTGDLVIVEADRGKDLGKVICDNLMSMASVSAYQSSHPDILSESPYGGKDITPKKVFRKASMNEVGLVRIEWLTLIVSLSQKAKTS